MDGSCEYIVQCCHTMKIGQHWCIDRRIFDDAFGWGMYEGLDRYAKNPRERLLNRLMGSGYGAFIVEQDAMTGNYTVSRHEPGDRLVYTEADRRHLLPQDVQKAIEDGRPA
ncbi:MAG: hypothetical protein ACR2P3_00295 [Geminicoccaceae bacterium]